MVGNEIASGLKSAVVKPISVKLRSFSSFSCGQWQLLKAFNINVFKILLLPEGI